jgi:hypothetical protein
MDHDEHDIAATERITITGGQTLRVFRSLSDARQADIMDVPSIERRKSCAEH